MKFLDTKHHKRFWDLRNSIPAEHNGNKKLLAIAYIMASSENMKKKMLPYINWIDGFNYKKMLIEELFTQDEEVLVKLAITFYDNGVDLQFNEVFSKLNQKQKEIALYIADYMYNKKELYEPDDGDLFIK